ncbi:MAG TPA: helix-turn-helix domain-containing protein [Ramlibacter sp.]|nr:helix-turn-helix domain-containing protein [Ramlibacter sp.]
MQATWFLLFDRFQLLDVCGPLQVLSTANDELRAAGREPLYDTLLRGSAAGAHRSSSGVVLEAQPLPRALPRAPHTVVVPGGPGAWNPAGTPAADDTQPLVDWLRRHAPRVQRVASVCTGAFLLARTGLLDGRSAVTHWAACEALRGERPSVQVQQDAIYFRDGPYWTSAGVTAGIDMALGMVEADCGRDIAMNVAKKLVVFFKRPGGQSQFSSQLLEQSAGDERVARLHAWIGRHLREALDVPRMAEQLAMSPRTFARFYTRETGVTPARAVEQIRLERACRLIESRRQTLKAIAQQCGFGSEEVMRRTFIRHLRVSPSEYRQRFA